jgi:hypothetical protein
MFGDKATTRNCALLLSFKIGREVCRDGGFNIHPLHCRKGRARIWGRGLVGSCTGLLGIRERRLDSF